MNTFDIIEGVCKDPRIGDFYNNPSFGYGGYCLPKDTKQLLSNYDGIPQNLIGAVVESNNTRKQFIIQDICGLLEKNNTSNKIIGIYKLAMKYNSDNFRDSAVFAIIDGLKAKGYQIVLFEPSLCKKDYLDCQIENDINAFMLKTDLIIANRIDELIIKAKHKVYSRDIFGRD